MKITKTYKVESAHIVRSCTSERCSHSIHGHSAKIEVMLESMILDNAQMVYDFGLMGGTIKHFIDSMDHCYLLCSKDKPEFKEFIKQNCERWIEFPFNPSAEMLSLFIMQGCQYILDHTKFSNGEHAPEVTGVCYHETETGCAECDGWDLDNLWDKDWSKQIVYSQGVQKDWPEGLQNILISGKLVTNPAPRDHQIDFK